MPDSRTKLRGSHELAEDIFSWLTHDVKAATKGLCLDPGDGTCWSLEEETNSEEDCILIEGIHMWTAISGLRS